MTTLTFDTYAFIRKLRDSGIPEEQAKAQVEALSLALEQFTDLAGKHDIRELELKIELLRAELRKDMAETKADLIRWIVGAGFLQTALITALLIKLSPAL